MSHFDFPGVVNSGFLRPAGGPARDSATGVGIDRVRVVKPEVVIAGHPAGGLVLGQLEHVGLAEGLLNTR